MVVVSVSRDGAGWLDTDRTLLSGRSQAVGLAGIDLMGRFFVCVGPGSSIQVQRTAWHTQPAVRRCGVGPRWKLEVVPREARPGRAGSTWCQTILPSIRSLIDQAIRGLGAVGEQNESNLNYRRHLETP